MVRSGPGEFIAVAQTIYKETAVTGPDEVSSLDLKDTSCPNCAQNATGYLRKHAVSSGPAAVFENLIHILCGRSRTIG